MRVVTKERFRDLKENKIREIGEHFEVSKERYAAILSKGSYIEKVKEVSKDE